MSKPHINKSEHNALLAQFAAAALTGILAYKPLDSDSFVGAGELAAEQAFNYAEDMVAAYAKYAEAEGGGK